MTDVTNHPHAEDGEGIRGIAIFDEDAAMAFLNGPEEFKEFLDRSGAYTTIVDLRFFMEAELASYIQGADDAIGPKNWFLALEGEEEYAGSYAVYKDWAS